MYYVKMYTAYTCGEEKYMYMYIVADALIVHAYMSICVSYP